MSIEATGLVKRRMRLCASNQDQTSYCQKCVLRIAVALSREVRLEPARDVCVDIMPLWSGHDPNIRMTAV